MKGQFLGRDGLEILVVPFLCYLSIIKTQDQSQCRREGNHISASLVCRAGSQRLLAY